MQESRTRTPWRISSSCWSSSSCCQKQGFQHQQLALTSVSRNLKDKRSGVPVLISYLPEANFVQRELHLLFKVTQIFHRERGQVLPHAVSHDDPEPVPLILHPCHLLDDFLHAEGNGY